MRYFLKTIRPITMGLATAMMVASPAVYAQSDQNRSGSQQQSQQDREEQRQRDRDDDRQRARGDREQDSQRRRDSRQRDQGQQDERQARSQQGDQWSQNQRSQGQRRQGQQRRQTSGQQRRVRLSPEGWVRIAADYDNDGRYDAFETIFIYDLEQAQQRSRQRRQGEGQMRRQDRRERMTREDSRGMQDRRRQERMRRDRQGREMRDQVVRGEIQSLKSVTLAGMDEPHWLAKVETDEGRTATVCLGKKNSLEQLGLQEGDQVEVRGKRARLNDRQVLVASNVRHDGQSVSVDLPSRSNMKRVKAELLDTREVRFRGFDQPFVVAQVRTNSGERELVNLGPASKVDQLNISSGDRLRLLVTQGRINGRDAMIAQEIESDGDQVQIATADDRERYNQRNRSRSRRQ